MIGNRDEGDRERYRKEEQARTEDRALVVPPVAALQIDYSLITRGIGFEIDGEWNSIHAARWSVFRRRWIVERDLIKLELELRAELEREIGGAAG